VDRGFLLRGVVGGVRARGRGVAPRGGGGRGEAEAAARSDTVPGISMLGGDGVRSARGGRT